MGTQGYYLCKCGAMYETIEAKRQCEAANHIEKRREVTEDENVPRRAGRSDYRRVPRVRRR